MLSWVRLASLSVLLVPAMMCSQFARRWVVAVALILFGLNLWLLHRLGDYASVNQVNTVARVATLLDWCVPVAALGFGTGNHAYTAPVAVLLAVIPASLRFGLYGVTGSSIAATALVVVWLALHVWVFDTWPFVQAVGRAGVWLGGVACLAGMLASAVTWYDWRLKLEQQSHERVLAGYLREHSGLSRREWEVLQLLKCDALTTYRMIGSLLSPPVDARTVGSHVRRIEKKLGVSGGRWRIVRAATDLGYIESGPCDGVDIDGTMTSKHWMSSRNHDDTPAY